MNPSQATPDPADNPNPPKNVLSGTTPASGVQNEEPIEVALANEAFSFTPAIRYQDDQLALDRTLQALTGILEIKLAPYGADYVQKLDEAKRPPLEVLQMMAGQGTLTLGTPLPPLEEAKALLHHSDLQPFFKNDAVQKMESVISFSQVHQHTRDLLSKLEESGYAIATCLSSQQLAQQTGVGVGTFIGVNIGLSAQTILRVGTPEQQAFWLNALNYGMLTYGFGLTEDRVGSDPRSIQTSYRKEVDENGDVNYVLNGNKKFIGNAARVTGPDGEVIHPGADFLIVFAVDDPEKAPKDRVFHAFMVPRSTIGEENIRHTGGEHNKMGLREVNNGDFDLKEVKIPAVCRLGHEDENIYPKIMGTLDITRLFVGAMSLGSAKASVEAARGYAKEREQNGGPIEQFQMVDFPLKELEAKILAADLLVRDAARMVDKADKLKNELSPLMESQLEQLKTSVTEIGEFITATGAANLSEALDSGSEKAISNFKKMQSTFRFGSSRRDFVRGVRELQQVTGELRSHALDEEQLTAIKSVYKKLNVLVNEVKALEQPVHFGTETAMAKLYCSELAETAARKGCDTLGGRGFLEDPSQGLGLTKRLRDAKVLTIYEGTSNINRNVITQGMIIKELQRIKGSFVEGLRFYLRKTGMTRDVAYGVVMSTSHSPQARSAAAYRYGIADVLTRYNTALQQVNSEWKRNGIPERYRDWDKDSLERQKNLLASLPVQARFGILADMAVNAKLLDLAGQHKKYLLSHPSPSEEQKHQLELLNLFEDLALEETFDLGRRLEGASLKRLEQRYNQKFQELIR